MTSITLLYLRYLSTQVAKSIIMELKAIYIDIITNSINSLPYTEAVLMEAQRLSSIAPFTIAHSAMVDTQLQGYTIPKVAIHSISIDPHWFLH